MQQKNLVLLTAFLLGLSVFSGISVQAQSPIEGPSWTIGWATDMDSTFIVDMDIDWDAEGEVVVYVENNAMTQLELSLEYEFETWVPFTFSGPETFSVAANGNETFSIEFDSINDDEAREYNPDNDSTLTITAEQKVGDTTASSQELDGDFSVPKIFDLRPSITLSEEQLFSGSSIELTAQILNNGNTKDAIKEASVQFRSCPHLTMVGVEELSNTVVEPTGAQNGKDTFVTLTLEASSSQPTRVCEVTLSLESEGDEASRSATFDVDVKASESEEDDSSSNDDDQDEDQAILTEESNSVPWVGAIELLMLLGLVSALRKQS
ncbi:MAG: hypothetical protein HN458_03990 [Euryarchaeota archaeon]|jgi:hypothetical protein|nr:hypothetical protein [Euryarchaeota archaeon]